MRNFADLIKDPVGFGVRRGRTAHNESHAALAEPH
jgi:hypothetical protein